MVACANTIKVSDAVLERLRALKVYPRDTNDDVLRRLLNLPEVPLYMRIDRINPELRR